jgi:hypothetical protein
MNCVGLGMNREWKEIEFPKEYLLYMNLETIRLRGRPRNIWQDEVREDGRIVGAEEWQEKVYNREEWKKVLRAARNCHVLHMAVGWMDELSHCAHGSGMDGWMNASPSFFLITFLLSRSSKIKYIVIYEEVYQVRK